MPTDTHRTLILGTSYIAEGREGAQNYGAKMVDLWARVTRHLNPFCNIMIVDSASPVSLADAITTKHPGLMIHQIGDNIGHINITGRDGWGRAFCRGVELAIRDGYDYIAYCDVDIIFTRPVAPIIEKMARSGVKAACPMDTQYNFLENGLMFLDVEYLRDTNFVARYDWKSRTNDGNRMNIPEMVFERLLDDVIFTLPLRGMRDDMGMLTVNNLEHRFPYGYPDYLTHCKDFEIYLKQIELAGIKL